MFVIKPLAWIVVAAGVAIGVGAFGRLASAQTVGAPAISRLLDALPRLETVYERKIAAAATDVGLDISTHFSPTLAAVRGLAAIHRGEILEARRNADLLLSSAEQRSDGLFFPFRWDYASAWPYDLKSPWVSALTQGLALALFDRLHAVQGLDADRDAARRVARSFALRVDAGGFLRMTEDGPYFEEYPLAVPTHVLNGAIIATLALHDHIALNPDSELAEILRGSRVWWRRNIARYTVVSERYPYPVSAYSLAPTRAELLLRFVGPGVGTIETITLKTGARLIELNVGAPDDANRTRDAYIWFNPAFQNWGEARSSSGSTHRDIRPGQGAYNHAPFSFALNLDKLDPSSSLTLRTLEITGGHLDLQIYDGTQYHLAGRLLPSEGPASYELPLPQAAINVLKSRSPAHPPVEPAYFTENRVLADLLASALDLPEVAREASLWRRSEALTPAQYDARLIFDDDRLAADPAPVLRTTPGTVEATHVEYPTLIRDGGQLIMFYAMIGTGPHWRIGMATSNDEGATWTKQGSVLRDSETSGFGSIAFPSIVLDAERQRYLLFFSVDTNRDGVYDTIMSAESASVWNWKLTSLRLPEQGLGLRVAREADGLLSMTFAEALAAKGFGLLERRSRDGQVWSAPTTLHAVRGYGHNGLYTHERFELGGQTFWIVDERIERDRLVWRLMCRGAADGRLRPVMDEPLHVSDPGADRWDQHRYGMRVVPVAPDPLIFFNGIRLDAGDGNGMIGRGRLKLPSVAFERFPAECRR